MGWCSLSDFSNILKVTSLSALRNEIGNNNRLNSGLENHKQYIILLNQVLHWGGAGDPMGHPNGIPIDLTEFFKKQSDVGGFIQF